MTNDEYIKELERLLKETVESVSFQYQKAQINAWRLNPSFSKSFSEFEIYGKINSLINISCILLKEENNACAIKTLESCARLLDNISQFAKSPLDNDYIKILSAMCYDLAGYQANAFCISKTVNDYVFELDNSEFELQEDNIIIDQFVLILQKRIILAKNRLEGVDFVYSDNFKILRKALLKWYSKILDLEESNYLDLIVKAYRKYLFSNNIYISNLLQLLKTKIYISEKRNIKNLVCESIGNLNGIWKKYLKLLASDYYDKSSVKDDEQKHSIYELWISQINAINQGILKKDESFVIQMPTSAGKTFIAELFILNKLAKEPQKHIIYISPYKALSTEKESDLGDRLEKLGYSVSVLPGSYEMDFFFQDLFPVETDVLIATPEKVDLLLRTNKEYFSNVSSIIVDEGHLIGDDGTRGVLLEFLIIRLKILYPEIHYLFISAVMSEENSQELACWLSNNDSHVITSSFNGEIWEPTQKLIGRFDWNVFDNHNGGRITYDKIFIGDGSNQHPFIQNYLSKNLNDFLLKDETKAAITAALAYKMSEKGQTLVFCGTVRDVASVYKRLKNLCFQFQSEHLPCNHDTASYYYAKDYFGKDADITQLFSYGIGIHYGKLPKQIRKSVEQDYKSGKMKILVCTNTIGQGLNFPIKNLIIHSTSYGHGFGDLSIKDFWNIVGRAGRAEKETEGQILYVINKPYVIDKLSKKKSPKYKKNPDEYKYEKYTAIKSYESINSKIYSRLKERITDMDKLTEILSNDIDTYLIDLLTEETIENNFEDIIEEIFNNSLFRIQALKHDYDTTPIKKVIKQRFNEFAQKITLQNKNLYSQTGLSFDTTEKILRYISSLKDSGVNIFENKYVILSHFLKFIASEKVSELNHYDLKDIDMNYQDGIDFFSSWIEGKSRQELLEIWKRLGQADENFYIFESTGLNYLFPWVLSAFIFIASNCYSDEKPDREILLLPTFLKNGVDKVCACVALNNGIQTRETALMLANLFAQENTKEFIGWLANLSDYDIDSMDVSKWEKENIRSVSNNICVVNYKKQPKEFFLNVKGTFYNKHFKIASLKVHNNDILSIEREKDNPHDPCAILVKHNDEPIGYLPKEDAKYISTEIDVNKTKYIAKVNQVVERRDFKEVRIYLSEVTDG